MNTEAPLSRADENAFYGQPLPKLRAAWMFVGKAFQDGHRSCEECDHCAHTSEPRSYGDGTVYEALTECTLGQRMRDVPEMCPAYLAMLQVQAEECADDTLGAV
jgi:hypothetical protein